MLSTKLHHYFSNEAIIVVNKKPISTNSISIILFYVCIGFVKNFIISDSFQKTENASKN